MFHSIRNEILNRMHYLEQLDAKDRADGTARTQRLRQIPPETGKLIALLAANSPSGPILEIGTSGGYSTLWLAVACEEMNREVTTFEILPAKIAIARETFHRTGCDRIVNLVEGDARQYLPLYQDIAFCFLDAEKEIYGDCYEIVVPRLGRGGILAADNAISHPEALQPILDRALSDGRVDAIIIPIGKGVLVCRKK
jgi:predicted O-methyltransferase YrrM